MFFVVELDPAWLFYLYFTSCPNCVFWGRKKQLQMLLYWCIWFFTFSTSFSNTLTYQVHQVASCSLRHLWRLIFHKSSAREKHDWAVNVCKQWCRAKSTECWMWWFFFIFFWFHFLVMGLFFVIYLGRWSSEFIFIHQNWVLQLQKVENPWLNLTI